MKHIFNVGAIAFLSTLVGLPVAAGGGSGGGTTTFPASGAYGWILKASGPTDALRYGLSLVHQSRSDTEYVIEAASLNVSDARLLSSGTVDTGTPSHAGCASFIGLHRRGRCARCANAGQWLGTVVEGQRSQATSACRFVISVNDDATPLNSRCIVSTAGSDGQYATADDE